MSDLDVPAAPTPARSGGTGVPVGRQYELDECRTGRPPDRVSRRVGPASPADHSSTCGWPTSDPSGLLESTRSRFVYVVDGEASAATLHQLVEAVESAYYTDDAPWQRLYAVDGDQLRPVIVTSHYIGVDGEDYLHTAHSLRLAGVLDTGEIARFTTRFDGLA